MTSEKTFLFYDIETTGLNKCFDQIMQFAAIRTDLQLNEIERHQFYVQLNPDVIPSPEALITHRISIKECEKGEKELDAIKKIHDLFNTPGTISLGYNTLGFDDEFLRFSFHRNLLPPYTHQYANQCSRMDLYPMAIMYYLFKCEALNWPQINDKISMKLEHLSHANNLATGLAHNAIVDVEATIALARIFFQFSEMWNYLCDYFDKQKDLERINKLESGFSNHSVDFKEALLVNGKIGVENNYQIPVLCLGQHQHYKNQTLWLRLDHESLQKTSMETIGEHTYVVHRKAGEELFLLPTQTRFLQKLARERLILAEENKKWLQRNSELFQKICHYHQHYKYPQHPNVDVDADLYNIGFPAPHEEFLFREFHAAQLHDKLKIIKKFPNPKRQLQGIRILGRNYPDLLKDEDQEFFNRFLLYIYKPENLDNPVTDYRGEERLKVNAALKRINELKLSVQETKQIQLLDELKIYLEKPPGSS